MLSRVRRLGRRMLRPGSSRLFRCLVVADVDLDTGTATSRPLLTPFTEAPEGVHAFVWLHGVPVAEVTMAGDPDSLLGELPRLAQQAAAEAVDDHLAQHQAGEGRPVDERSP